MKVKVPAADGTVLAANISGPDRPALTLLMAHGFCMNSSSWLRPSRALTAACPDLRVVTYDHRGHGASDDGPRTSHTIGTLADDLADIVEATAGDSPLVLAGHSLGAMTILACLRKHPDLVPRLRGAALVATASGRLADFGGIARLLPASVGRALPTIARRVPVAFDSVWGATRTVMSPALGNCSHLRRPSSMVLAELLSSLLALDESASVQHLAAVPTTILVGGRDRITPAAHAKGIADAVPLARLHVLPGAGHNLTLSHPQIVSADIADLVARVHPASTDAARPAAV